MWLGLSFTYSAWVVSVANVVSTLIGIPISWAVLLPLAIFPKKKLPGVIWRVILEGDEQPKPWIQLTAALFLMIPFFFASWWIEYQIAQLMLPGLGFRQIDDGVFVGNLVTYSILAFLVLCVLIWEIMTSLTLSLNKYSFLSQKDSNYKDRDRAEYRGRHNRKGNVIKGPISIAQSIMDTVLSWIFQGTLVLGFGIFALVVVLGGPALLFWAINAFLPGFWILLCLIFYLYYLGSLIAGGKKFRSEPMEVNRINSKELNGNNEIRPLPNENESLMEKTEDEAAEIESRAEAFMVREEARERAFKARQEAFAEANRLSMQGHSYYIRGRYGEAEPLLERSLAIWEEQDLHPNDPTVAKQLGITIPPTVLYQATKVIK